MRKFLQISVTSLVIFSMAFVGLASARPQEGFTVSKAQPVEKDYPAMGAGCPACTTRGAGAGLATLPSSGQCGGSYAWCDAIPVEIIPPQGLEDDRDIFFTIIELHWDDSTGNDMDLRFYDNQQSTGSYEQLGSSESTKNPEVIRVANADLGEYNIVAINFQGANSGYKIKARITTDPFTNPNESLAPRPPDQPEDDEKDEEPEFTAPEDKSGAPPPAPADPTLEPVQSGDADADFDFGFSDLDERITINTDDFGPQAVAPSTTKKEPVNPAVLLASLIGGPALIVGSGAAYAWRRRQALPL